MDEKIIQATNENLNDFSFKDPVFTKVELELYDNYIELCKKFITEYKFPKLNGLTLNSLDVELMQNLASDEEIKKCVVKSKMEKPHPHIFNSFILIELESIPKPFTFTIKRVF
jgi:hypothetical protein